jgi:hypothetical protein
MKPVNNETIVRQLDWPYATKRFDPEMTGRARYGTHGGRGVFAAPSTAKTSFQNPRPVLRQKRAD